MRKLITPVGVRRLISLCFIFLCLSLPTWATDGEDKHDEVTFARFFCDYDRLIEGDSCLVSFVVYASSPFTIEKNASKIKVKNGNLRPWPLRRQHLQRVRQDGGIYYALLVEEYVVHTKDVGKMIILPRDYVVELSVQQGYVDPFDAFFAPPPKVEKIKLKGVSERFVLNVVEKPQRTTKQMMNSGLEII